MTTDVILPSIYFAYEGRELKWLVEIKLIDKNQLTSELSLISANLKCPYRITRMMQRFKLKNRRAQGKCTCYVRVFNRMELMDYISSLGIMTFPPP